MIAAFEEELYTRSFIETIKMSKLLPFILDECELVETELEGLENQTS